MIIDPTRFQGILVGEEQYFEMLWDCASCGTKGLFGKSQRHCPLCGCAQDPTKRYFPEPGQETEAQGHVFVGADWRCIYCQSPNAAASAFCCNCGASQDGAKKVATIADPLGNQPIQLQAPEIEKKHGMNKWRLVAISMVIVLFGVLAGLFLNKKEVITQVTQAQWQREIEVERYIAASDSAWCDAMPSGAYSISRTQEVRSQRQIADGHVCKNVRIDKGDGTFSQKQECTTRYRDEPVYDYKCRFMINRWQVVRKLRESGDSTRAPYWPVTSLSSRQGSAIGRLGDEQLGNKLERYKVTLSSDKKTFECEVPAAQWAQLTPGVQVSLKVRSLGGAVCDSIQLR